MRILLDTNVILDLMFKRNPWRAAAEEMAEAGSDGHIHVYTIAS